MGQPTFINLSLYFPYFYAFMIRQAFHCKHVKDLCSQVILLFLVSSNLFFIEGECLDSVLTIPYGSLEDSS